ncbi:MAG: FtsX-like permease family protein, partial [Opitutus sp.]|nr:FtsX-like permease family protein [Opitutus sp.]
MLTDLRFAFRSLAKSPGFAAAAVLSLALGIGANTAVFSVMNAVLLATLPVKNPHELVVFNWLAEENVGPPATSGWQQIEPGTRQLTSTSFSLATFEAFQRQEKSPLSETFAFAPLRDLHVVVDGNAEVVTGAQVASGGYHTGLGATAVAGRLFTPSDDRPEADTVAVISYRYWQRRFGAMPDAIGKAVAINGVPATIIGVTAPAFAGAMQIGEVVDVTLPLAHETRFNRGGSADNRKADFWWVRVMGRLKPGVTRAQAQAALEPAFFDTARGNVRLTPLPGAPAVDPANVPLPRLRAVPGGQGLYEQRRDMERPLRLLTGVVALVLLVACANVANLLLARGAARRREIAVRLALGAGRARIVRQLLVESVLLAALGAAVGVVLALWGAPALLALQPA